MNEKHTIVEHKSLEMPQKELNIHGNMLEWLENLLIVLQFSLQMFQKAIDILEFKPEIQANVPQIYKFTG